MPLSDSPHTWPRLFVKDPLESGASIALSPDQTHYLCHVLRAGAGGPVRLFNGRDGEWIARLDALPARKKDPARLTLETQRRAQSGGPAPVLCCAPIKRAHFEFMVMKATELGVSAIQPVLTERTQIRECNMDRLTAIAIEAAEQSERLDVPELLAPVPLPRLLEGWPAGRLALICAEFGPALPLAKALALPLAQTDGAASIFTGPEGGFTQDEMALFDRIETRLSLRLGPRILRADTAALAALSCYQALCGDWRGQDA